MNVALAIFLLTLVFSIVSIVAWTKNCACRCGPEECRCDGGHCQRCAGCTLCKTRPRPGCNCSFCRGK